MSRILPLLSLFAFACAVEEELPVEDAEVEDAVNEEPDMVDFSKPRLDAEPRFDVMDDDEGGLDELPPLDVDGEPPADDLELPA